MTTTTKEVTNSEDVIDVRDVIARVEELERFVAEGDYEGDADDAEELKRLQSLLDELRGNGGDEEWRGDWYPVTLIRDSYFAEYAQELAEDIGAISSEHSWPLNCIDWKQAADELLTDYAAVVFDGIEYYYR